jgi:hypothetical protein
MSATEKELRTRLAILEAALACVREECEVAHVEPTIAMTTICRIDRVSRQALTASGFRGSFASLQSPEA